MYYLRKYFTDHTALKKVLINDASPQFLCCFVQFVALNVEVYNHSTLIIKKKNHTDSLTVFQLVHIKLFIQNGDQACCIRHVSTIWASCNHSIFIASAPQN